MFLGLLNMLYVVSCLQITPYKENKIFSTHVLYIEDKGLEKLIDFKVKEHLHDDYSESKTLVTEKLMRAVPQYEVRKLLNSKTVQNSFPEMRKRDLNMYEMFFTVSLRKDKAAHIKITGKKEGNTLFEIANVKITCNTVDKKPSFHVEVEKTAHDDSIVFGAFIGNDLMLISSKTHIFNPYDIVEKDSISNSLQTVSNDSFTTNPIETKQTETIKPQKLENPSDKPIQYKNTFFSTNNEDINKTGATSYREVVYIYYDTLENNGKLRISRDKKERNSNSMTYMGMFLTFSFVAFVFCCVIVVIYIIKSK